jgi:hypothetical protein
VHAAPGITPTAPSAILNNWATEEQSLDHVASQLQVLRHATALAEKEDNSMGEEQQGHWIEQALQGAIAHILDFLPSVPTQAAPPMPVSTHKGAALPLPPTPAISAAGALANIVLVLVDEDQPRVKFEPQDMQLNGNGDTQRDRQGDGGLSWSYGEGDLRKMLFSALQSLRDTIRNSK